MDERIPAELQGKLKACRSLPSPPTYALQVLEMVNDPEVEIDKAVQVLSLDPAIVSKIFRIANSPLYAHLRKVETLKTAVLLLGLNATTSLALSFSLVTGLRHKGHSASLNHPFYWKRAGLAAAASRVLGQYCEIRELEELFIAALLQDIGMLALNQVLPDLYAGPTLNQADHTCVVTHEQNQLGVTHATVGGWLLGQWQLPERLQMAVAYSERPLQFPPEDERATFVRCVAGSGAMANLFLNEATNHAFQDIGKKLEEWLGLPREQLFGLLEQMLPVLAEVDQLYDMNISPDVNSEDLIEQARESLVTKSLEVSQEVEQFKETTVSLESEKDQLKSAAQRDPLTQVFNRGFLDAYLDKAFQKSLQDGTSLTVGFLDLDHFKHVNDAYGHLAGDHVLKTAANLLLTAVRASDVVGRYGGEEFLVVLPDTSAAGYKEIFQRILEAFRRTRHDISEGPPISVTMSIGVATHSSEQPFPDVVALVGAADQAMYGAKDNGRNRCMYAP